MRYSLHQLHDSNEYQLTKILPCNDTRFPSVYNEIQGHQLMFQVIYLKRITLTTWPLVQLVRVAPLESPLSRLEQVVSIGQPSKFTSGQEKQELSNERDPTVKINWKQLFAKMSLMRDVCANWMLLSYDCALTYCYEWTNAKQWTEKSFLTKFILKWNSPYTSYIVSPST